MLRYLSSDAVVAVVFMLPELIDRMAQMLNHFLKMLLGSKCSTLKVDEPERYNFNAKKLLLEIASTVVNFSRFVEFPQAMVRACVKLIRRCPAVPGAVFRPITSSI